VTDWANGDFRNNALWGVAIQYRARYENNATGYVGEWTVPFGYTFARANPPQIAVTAGEGEIDVSIDGSPAPTDFTILRWTGSPAIIDIAIADLPASVSVSSGEYSGTWRWVRIVAGTEVESQASSPASEFTVT
jgi:hypothetical protein